MKAKYFELYSILNNFSRTVLESIIQVTYEMPPERGLQKVTLIYSNIFNFPCVMLASKGFFLVAPQGRILFFPVVLISHEKTHLKNTRQLHQHCVYPTRLSLLQFFGGISAKCYMVHHQCFHEKQT